MISETGSATNSASTGTAVAVTHGLTINSGDVVVAMIHANGTGNTITDNNGGSAFTDDFQSAGAISNQYAIMSRVAGASEPSAYAWTLNSSNRWSVQIRVFSSVDAAIWDVAPVVGNQAKGEGATIAAPSITTINDGAMGIVLGLTDRSNGLFTAVGNGYGTKVEPVNNQSQASFIRTWATAGVTGSVDVTMSPDLLLMTVHHFALKEAAAPTGNPWYYYANQAQLAGRV